MNQVLKFTFIISLLFIGSVQAQEEKKDEVVYKQRYGLRVGADISKPLRSIFDTDYYGMEFVGDYRLSYKHYAAAELGMEKKATQEDYFAYTTTGQYLKVGIDSNTYGNWYGMENLIYVGARYAFSVFSQQLDSYSIYKTNQYWTEDTTGKSSDWLRNYDGRTAHWIELVLGMKVELFKNFFASPSIRLGVLVANPTKDFPNYYIPGFGRVREGSYFGVNYNYTMTYLIPLYRKEKNKESKKNSEPNK